MNTEAEIRTNGMQALIGALGLVDAERFMATTLRGRFNYTEWRRLDLPNIGLQELAAAANPKRAALPAQPGSVNWKMASFQTLDYLRREAELGKREDFEQFFKLVPDAPAQAGDELSPDIHVSSKTRNRKL